MFDKLLPTIRTVDTPLIPDILFKKQTEVDLLNGIISGSLYGFIQCDVESGPDVIDKLKDFPPLIKRETVTDANLSEYMRNRIKHEKPELQSFERETLIQCFNAKQILLMTPLAQYYVRKGLKITNITRFVQYIPRKSLLPFVNHVTNMRITAEKNGNTTKGNTAKIFGNSGYGKVIGF